MPVRRGIQLAVCTLAVAACAESSLEQPAPTAATATPAPATATTPSAANSGAPASATPASSAARASAAPAQTAPPPLRAGTAELPFASDAKDAGAACTPDVLRARLQEIVTKCRGKAKSLCGKVTVRATGGDASAVSASVDLSSTTGAGDFVRCVTDQVNAVRWECAEPGQDIAVDLGCKL